MVIAETLVGIQLVKSAVTGIKEVIHTCQDIHEISHHIDNVFSGQEHIDKKIAEKKKKTKSGIAGKWQTFIGSKLGEQEGDGTSIQEIEDYCFRNEVDVVFVDQLDKVRIDGEFSRGDERLKELYARSRELAKRNKVAVWAVSQASYEAHGREVIDYSMLDGSKTGKAGEADIIIGIGVSEHEDFRTLKFSKNKINGYHGSLVLRRDGDRDIFL